MNPELTPQENAAVRSLATTIRWSSIALIIIGLLQTVTDVVALFFLQWSAASAGAIFVLSISVLLAALIPFTNLFFGIKWLRFANRLPKQPYGIMKYAHKTTNLVPIIVNGTFALLTMSSRWNFSLNVIALGISLVACYYFKNETKEHRELFTSLDERMQPPASLPDKTTN